ncbi:amidohydrolase family protein [Thiorhodococcus minor]|uniref:Amidohydrolase family protein n=1 Tax=Thiorhodococcus minor TaxID=57489 RepID=A0A6M0K7N7_9GAMM|nr:amidohydrolase family protein [Thiorhodococcus minor]NEV64395.1 amidohydrolase family protein [Thiorhodococcus minor]
MASSLIRGKHLICAITDDDQAEIIEDGALFQRDGQIIEVGRYDKLSQRVQPDAVLGDGSHIVVPGFVNAHHHLGITPIQLGCPDVPLELWIPHRLAARSVDPYLDTLYSAFEMIESGITTAQHINSLFFGPVEPCAQVAEAVLRAYRDIGMRVSYSFMMHDQNHLVYEADDQFVARLPPALGRRMAEFFHALELPVADQLKLFEELHQRHQQEPLIRIQLAPGNLHWSSDELLEMFADISTRFAVPMHMHLVETPYQKEYARRRTGTTAVHYLHRHKLLSDKMTLGHGVWLTDDDIDILADTHTHVCHCPSSNLRLRSGIAPLNRLTARGIDVAIGIDEAGINDDRDMLQEMRLMLNLHREPGLEHAVPSPERVFRMATEHGAKTTPFGSQIGTLKPGKAADVVLIRWQQVAGPYMDTDVPVTRAMLHRAKSSGIDTVIVAGDPIYRDGHFMKIDKEAVVRELAESLQVPLTAGEAHRRNIAGELHHHVDAFYRGYLHSDVRKPYYQRNSSV